MDIKDGDNNGSIVTQITSEVDDKDGSKTKTDKVGGADGRDRKGEMTKNKSITNCSEKVLNKTMRETTKSATNAKLQMY